jgi:hypothetical protein
MLTKKMSICVTVMFFGLWAASSYGDITVINSPFSGSGGDFLYRGFYVTNYGADNLAQVTLQYWATTTGTYDTSLTVRIGSYDGTIVGATMNLSTYIEAETSKQVVYDFGGISVPYNSLLTFTQVEVDGPTSALYYDVGVTPHSQIIETEGTTPPLDTYRRGQVGVIITAIPEPATLMLLGLGMVTLRKKQR